MYSIKEIIFSMSNQVFKIIIKESMTVSWGIIYILSLELKGLDCVYDVLLINWTVL